MTTHYTPPQLLSCNGKIRHDSQAAATAHLKSIKARGTMRSSNKGVQLGSYRCLYCDGWHIGSAPKRLKMKGH